MPTTLRIALAIAVTIALAAALAGCRSAPEAEGAVLSVFAASSTTDAVGELAAAFEASTGIAVRTSFASSSTLARQIADGAPADVFVSANPQWMDFLQDKGLLVEASRRDLLGNDLVLIAPAAGRLQAPASAAFDLPAAFEGRLALGDPAHVPAGQYARRALEHLGWWDALASRLAPAPDVRAALALVERGEVDAGIVYATDAAASDRVRVVYTFPTGSHPPILYPAAALKSGRVKKAQAFLEFLGGEQARQILQKHGFRVKP